MSLFRGFDHCLQSEGISRSSSSPTPVGRYWKWGSNPYAFFLPPSGLGRENAVIPMGMKSALWNQKWAVTHPSSESAAICSSAVSLGNLETERERRVGMGKKRSRQSKNARNYFFPRWIMVLRPKKNVAAKLLYICTTCTHPQSMTLANTNRAK